MRLHRAQQQYSLSGMPLSTNGAVIGWWVSAGCVQAKFHLEQQCHQLQQQAAGLSAKVHHLTGRCEDAEADAQALQHRLGLEAERVCTGTPPTNAC